MSPDREAPIRIVPYDPGWPRLFELERALLAAVLRPWLVGPIEHIGSTAVPWLAAKPVIDIMAPVAGLDASRDAQAPLRERGYQYAPYRSDVMHWFCKPSFAVRTHHLHLVPFSSRLWEERLRFRDCLRSSPSLADEYATLKGELAARYPEDREAYTEAKGPFIARVLEATADRPGVRA